MDNSLTERIAEYYYINSDEYESLRDCIGEIAEKYDLSSEWIGKNFENIHFIASFLEFEFTKDTAEIYEELHNKERSPESVIEDYNLNPELFKALLRDE